MKPPWPLVSGCAVCRSGDLRLHLRVAGGAGPQGLIPTTEQFGTALADIVRCRRCGHMQLSRFPPAGELLHAYGEAESLDYVEEEAGQRLTARAALERIERHVPRGALLDVGCWVGFLLDEGRRRGWTVEGIEPSRFAADLARRRFGLTVHTADLFTAELPPGRFQAVVLGDVLEHLPDPAGALARVAELLAPEGVLLMTLPDAGSRVARLMGRRWWSIIPTHVQYFTRASITTLLGEHDWTVLELATAPKAFTVGYYLGRIGGYVPAAGRMLVTGAQRLGWAERLWAPDFRDRMAVLARRPPHPR